MAKNKSNEVSEETVEGMEAEAVQVEATEAEEVAAPVADANVVTFEDGTVRDFGKKGQIQKEVSIDETGISVTLYLITGIIKTFLFERSNALYDLMAQRGVIEYIGNSIAGVFQDKEGTHPEDFNLGIEQAIANLLSGSIPVRGKGDSSTKGMGDLIRAYVELRGADSRFSEEEASYDFIKNLILGSDEATNKARLAQVPVRAKIEEYKLERQKTKTDAAKARVSAVAALI